MSSLWIIHNLRTIRWESVPVITNEFSSNTRSRFVFMHCYNLTRQHSFFKKECTNWQHSVFLEQQDEKTYTDQLYPPAANINSIQYLLNTYPRKQIANLCTGKPILIYSTNLYSTERYWKTVDLKPRNVLQLIVPWCTQIQTFNRLW